MIGTVFLDMNDRIHQHTNRILCQVYQKPDAMFATKPYRIDNHYFPWLAASLENCDDSVQVYGKAQELLFYNNHHRLFDHAAELDLLNVYTVFSYLQKTYINTKDAIDIILNIYKNPTPRFFNLYRIDTELIVECRAYPVLKQEKLLGVVVTNH